MRAIKSILSVITAMLILLIGVFSTSAVVAGHYYGDVDCDGGVTVKDATLIQKYIAEIVSLNIKQLEAADVDGDGVVTVKDATMIQKKCADIIDSFNTPEYILDNVKMLQLLPEYESGSTYVGVPVTFTALAEGEPEPLTYQFYINGEAITEVTEESSFTYTFSSADEYTVTAVVYNGFKEYGVFDVASIENYVVTQSYEDDNLVDVKNFYHNYFGTEITNYDDNIVFTAEGMKGSGVYEYAFYIDGELKQDFSKKNTLSVERFSEIKDYKIAVQIRDVVTDDMASSVMIISVIESAPA